VGDKLFNCEARMGGGGGFKTKINFFLGLLFIRGEGGGG